MPEDGRDGHAGPVSERKFDRFALARLYWGWPGRFIAIRAASSETSSVSKAGDLDYDPAGESCVLVSVQLNDLMRICLAELFVSLELTAVFQREYASQGFC